MTSSRSAVPPLGQVRVARPTDRLDEVVAFYRDGLGLPELGRFAGHAGYRGVLLGLPGAGHHLEFTHHDDGSPGPAPTRDNLLVLYLGDRAAVDRVAAGLAGRGHHPVTAENPYWTALGAVTVEDPDGWRVVLVPRPGTEPELAEPVVEWFEGERDAVRPLFELAEDSAAELDSSLRCGRVLVARAGTELVGHLQLVRTEEPGEAELKNMAVREDLRGRGIGGRLVRAALAALAAEGTATLRVATGAADVRNLVFYQRQGFRMRSIERDVFTPAAGYPAGLEVDGIPLRDRVWLDRAVGEDPS
ncbi:GNAT family N-acetyltransferase [Pseudonocardia kujensis]|uniref:GNAT family N-acetyltransferase n=1 Tax=Pseudonocardia kujensis TaxID=1128675 RepID=UPI0027E01D49|nr:GNAT family N-acetyltransferase [Pseudonocardia kujensis]